MTNMLYKRLLQYAKPYWVIFSIGIVATAIAAMVDASAAYTLKPLINLGFVGRDPTFIRWFPLLVLAAFFVRGVATFLSSYCMSWVSRKVVMLLRQDMFGHFQKLPAAFYDRSSSGRLLSKLLYDVEQMAQLSTDSLTTLISSFCMVLGLLVVIFLISWQLSLLFFLIAPVIILIVRYTNQRVRQLSYLVQRSMAEVTEIAEENIEGYREVRIFGGESREITKFNAATNRARVGDMKAIIAKGINVSGVQIVASLAISMVGYLAINPTFSTSLTAGAFTSMMVSMLALLKPLKDLSKVNSEIQRGLAGARSIFEMTDTDTEVDTGTRTLENCLGEIEFDHVFFNYDDDKPMLCDIDLKIPSGKTVAFVGRSGAGKTTLTSLLPRFYEATAGRILIDGIDIRQLSLPNLRKHIALVSQQVTLFNGTVRDNIAYGLEDVSDALIREAAVAAHAWEFIAHLPQGLETIVGENGVLLSGGQRQRLAIARAIVKNAPILILDEATSALDTEAERHIQMALNALMKNRTTLVIAHRLSTIENADTIVVMEQGKISEMGDHRELLSHNGSYAHLHRLQFSEQAWM